MQSTLKPFKTILFGFAFSPSLRANIFETTRIAHYFGAKLILLHVGAKSEKKLREINTLLGEVEFKDPSVEIMWKSGKPFDVIHKACAALNVELLILGAMQHENMFQFYVGSIARKLTRKVCCSVMLLIKPSALRVPCKHVVVNGFDAPETSIAIRAAFFLASALGAHQLTIVEEILQKELHVTVEDDRSLKKANIMKERLKRREEARLKKIIADIPKEWTKKISTKTQSIFGKRGYSIGHYAEVVRADLLVMNAPTKTGILDRIFPHDIEYILSDLPTDLLIIRNRSL